MMNDADYHPVVLSTGIEYLGWNAIQISRGPVSLYLVPEIGGRIMGIRFRDRDICFVRPERMGHVPSPQERFDIETWRKKLEQPLWGGRRTLLSSAEQPEAAACFPDLDCGPYRFELHSLNMERGEVVLQSSICRDSKLRLCKRITMDFIDAAWTVDLCIENCGEECWSGRVMDALMLHRPGVAYVPATHDASHNNRIRHSSLSPDHVEIECDHSEEFRQGIQLNSGWIAVQLPDDIGYLRVFDFCGESERFQECSADVYNSALYPYFEIECRSPTLTLRPGQKSSFKVVEQVGCWDGLLKQIKAGDVGYEFI